MTLSDETGAVKLFFRKLHVKIARGEEAAQEMETARKILQALSSKRRRQTLAMYYLQPEEMNTAKLSQQSGQKYETAEKQMFRAIHEAAAVYQKIQSMGDGKAEAEAGSTVCREIAKAREAGKTIAQISKETGYSKRQVIRLQKKAREESKQSRRACFRTDT